MKREYKKKVIALGVVGGIVFLFTELMIYLGNVPVAMLGMFLFVAIAFEMVIISGYKDDQEEKIDQLLRLAKEQNRRIMAAEGKLAKANRQLQEYRDNNIVTEREDESGDAVEPDLKKNLYF
ncbi:MAG: hypothetical protein ACI4E1_01010 [Lachnospira sp.]